MFGLSVFEYRIDANTTTPFKFPSRGFWCCCIQIWAKYDRCNQVFVLKSGLFASIRYTSWIWVFCCRVLKCSELKMILRDFTKKGAPQSLIKDDSVMVVYHTFHLYWLAMRYCIYRLHYSKSSHNVHYGLWGVNICWSCLIFLFYI